MMALMANAEKFSDKLESWLKDSRPKTVASLNEVFAEKSLAIVILLLMVLPALPLPTGGVTHLFEIIAMLLALELAAGASRVWLPNRWRNIRLSSAIERRTVPQLLRRIRWVEKRSSPRWKTTFKAMPLIAVAIFAFVLAAFLAPPFSGLDTIPSLGVVLICLSIIFDDALILLIGILTGALGTFIVIGLGAALVSLIRGL